MTHEIHTKLGMIERLQGALGMTGLYKLSVLEVQGLWTTAISHRPTKLKMIEWCKEN